MRVIETERLVLRPPEQQDFEGWAAFLSDEETARFVGGVQPRASAWRSMATMAGSWSLLGFGMFSVIEKATGRWVGRLGPWMPEGWPGTEVGWGLAKAAQGRGYGVEGSTAAIDWAFDNLGWTEVIHCIEPANRPSQQLAARLGSRVLRQTQLPPPFQTIQVDVWGQSRDDWKARTAKLAAH